MAMDGSALGDKILKTMRDYISAGFPAATPQDFQKIICKAIGVGIVNSVKTAKGLGPVGSSAGGPSIGITGLAPPAMLTIAQGVFTSKVGSMGPAVIPMLTAVFTEIVMHMTKVTVTSTSGSGGALNKVTGLTPEVTLANILKELPPESKAMMMSSPAGPVLFEAISTGFTKILLTTGIPAPIPSSGDPVGPIVASFS